MDDDSLEPGYAHAGIIEVEEEVAELYEHHRFIVDKGQGLLRIDKFLANKIEGVSRNKVQNAAKADCILVNEKPVKSNYRVKPLDVISVVLPNPPHEFEVIAEDIAFDCVYEDDDVLVVNKPAGLVVHPGYGNFTGTLLNALTFYLQGKKNSRGEEVAPYLVHRIDKDTSGLLLVAKTELAQTALARQFFNHTVYRRYNALVWGILHEDTGTIDGYIGRSAKDRRVMAVNADPEFGRNAITHWTVLERFRYTTLVECRLETGRTHQIRAHFKYIGAPLFGDPVYGGNIILKGNQTGAYSQFIKNCFDALPRQALHARSIGFMHPTLGQYRQFDSELPEDMTLIIEKWRRYSKGENVSN